MKLGRTQIEREERERSREGIETIFAFLPVFCWNTDRWVWLERVKRVRCYNPIHQEIQEHYIEIT
jgi:hypothetical protein